MKEEGGEGERSGEEKWRRGEGERRSGGRSGGEKEKREGEGAGGIQKLESRTTILWRMGYMCATELSFFLFCWKNSSVGHNFFLFGILRIGEMSNRVNLGEGGSDIFSSFFYGIKCIFST